MMMCLFEYTLRVKKTLCPAKTFADQIEVEPNLMENLFVVGSDPPAPNSKWAS